MGIDFCSDCEKVSAYAQSVINRRITIDGEGIILIYESNERMMKGIASSYINQIREMIAQGTGNDFVVKTAFSEDIEDNIIDYWSIKDDVGETVQTSTADAPAGSAVEGDRTDPIDKLITRFPEIVEVTDESEFLDYKPEDESFEQSELDEEEESEEFFSDEEKQSMSD